jgi:hypothetical protein
MGRAASIRVAYAAAAASRSKRTRDGNVAGSFGGGIALAIVRSAGVPLPQHACEV